MSSHIAQIGGLKRSKRENKDYLITQEKKELGLDLVLTIIPPFMINNFLKKKLESGMITTRESRERLINVVAPTVGVQREELYSTEHIRPVKEVLASLGYQLTNLILEKDRKMPKSVSNELANVNQHLKSKLPDEVIRFPSATLKDITTDFDNGVMNKTVSKNVFKQFRNNSAYDDLCAQNEGILIMTSLIYLITVSNIVMPFLTNKLANKSYKKQLEKMGETKESMKRKQRFAYTKAPLEGDEEIKQNVFDVISSPDKNTSAAVFNDFTRKQTQPKDLFSNFNSYNNIYTQPKGLRI
jgi:hypothetical protein